MPTRDVAVPHSIRKDSRLFVELCEAVLRRGLPVQFTVHGQSMQPNLLDGDTVLVQPAAPGQLRLGDVALMQTAQGICVHRVSHISGSKITTRGDAGLENDPHPARLFGKVVSRCRDSREQSFSAWRTRVVHPLLSFSRRIRAAAAIRLRRATSLVIGALGLLSLLAAVFASAASAQTTPNAQEQPAQPAPLGLVASATSAHLGMRLPRKAPLSIPAIISSRTTTARCSFASGPCPSNCKALLPRTSIALPTARSSN